MSRSAVALFCDDYRLEVTGKRLLIGVYTSDLQVASFPAQIRDLVILIVAKAPASDPFQKFSVRIVVPGREDIVGQGQPPSADLLQKAAGDPDGILTWEAAVRTGPFEVKEKGRIRVIVSTEREQFIAGTLDLTDMTSATTAVAATA